MRPFSKRFEVQWAHLDANRHVRNTAYLDFATHVRFAFLAENGFPASRFGAENFGPVIFRDELRYLREVAPDDTLTVDYRLAGAREDWSRFRLSHRVYGGDGALAAEIVADGAWMELSSRELIAPPGELVRAMESLERTEDFEAL